MKDARRIKLVLILAVLVGSALALLAWTQPWGHVTVSLSDSATERIGVTGAVAAPALTALALAGLALAGALSIAGVLIRAILGFLEILLGLSVFLSAYLATSNLPLASAAAVTKATGVAGTESILASVVDSGTTGWPYLAFVASVLMLAAGVAVIVTSTRWPGAKGRKASRFEPAVSSDAAAARAGDAVGDWDELSRGQDPTA